MSVAGCVIPPEGYLSRLEERVREADGLLIFDCVQTGCGRFGKGKWWGFEGHGAVPDMVTVGKPLGGGVAVSALAVRASALEAFEATGVEYFNTFGGSTLPCAAALAVMEEIDRLALPERAEEVGGKLKRGFEAVMGKHPGVVRDVRGCGLFLGVEISGGTDGGSETSFICSRLKNTHRILTTVDGPADNVIIVKPPLTFGQEEADYYLGCFEECLEEVKRVKARGAWVDGGKTPT